MCRATRTVRHSSPCATFLIAHISPSIPSARRCLAIPLYGIRLKNGTLGELALLSQIIANTTRSASSVSISLLAYQLVRPADECRVGLYEGCAL